VTVTPNTPIYTRANVKEPRLTEEQLLLLKQQVVGLRRVSDKTGFSTSRLIVGLLSTLTDADLIRLGLLFVDDPTNGNK